MTKVGACGGCRSSSGARRSNENTFLCGGPIGRKLDPMDLVALEEIKRLKHRYLRSVDTKDWDGLADVLTADATADYGTPTYGRPLKLEGRDAIVGFMRKQLGPGLITTHHATQPEID